MKPKKHFLLKHIHLFFTHCRCCVVIVLVLQLDATGRPDESLAVEIVGPLQSTSEENLAGKLLSFSLQKGHLKANGCYRPFHSATLEVLSTFFQLFTLLLIICYHALLSCLILIIQTLFICNQVRHLPLDELELASLRGAISRVHFSFDYSILILVLLI